MSSISMSVRSVAERLPKRPHRIFKYEYTSGLLDRYSQAFHKAGRLEFKQLRGAAPLEIGAKRLRRGD